ncbi:MAG: hypothetical protein ACYC7E_05480 [Armatimonadota bacterium]
MNIILAHPWFLHFAVPLLTVMLGIYLKFVTRNDHHTPLVKEDLAFGLDVAVIALLLFITSSVNIAHTATTTVDATIRLKLEEKLMAVPWLLLGFVLGIWAVSTLVRKLGWNDESELNLLGIIAPDVFGVTLLVLVVNWIG